MISTLTASTISTITTSAMTGSVALIALLVLLSLLIQKELATLNENPRLKKFSRMLNVGILPLLVVFLITVGVRIFEIIR